MTRALSLLLAVIVAAIATGGLGLLFYGRERAWERVAPSDLGDVDFDTLQRVPTPNDALAATLGTTPVPPDLELPGYDATPERLIDIVAERIAMVAPDAEMVSREPTRLRVVTRSRLMRFPDTTVVDATALDDGRTALRAYARASVGKSDLGANLARLEAWLTDLPAQ